ncbi:hypothetical protein GOV12_06990 [Candidatus Pacearchaeota archaeon]|nr:hypothetical protein [Candidatus Pacearchaeota archaeon]
MKISKSDLLKGFVEIYNLDVAERKSKCACCQSEIIPKMEIIGLFLQGRLCSKCTLMSINCRIKLYENNIVYTKLHKKNFEDWANSEHGENILTLKELEDEN